MSITPLTGWIEAKPSEPLGLSKSEAKQIAVEETSYGPLSLSTTNGPR